MFVPTIKYRRATPHTPEEKIVAPSAPLTPVAPPQTPPVPKEPEAPPNEPVPPPANTLSYGITFEEVSDDNDSDNDEKVASQKDDVVQQGDNGATTDGETKSRGQAATTGPTIAIDPQDDEQLLITLSNGTKYTVDRYCPHAGADLSYLGKVEENEYPPEIGPILVCGLHYWEFLLKHKGRSANGVATINSCPATCASTDQKLDW